MYLFSHSIFLLNIRTGGIGRSRRRRRIINLVSIFLLHLFPLNIRTVGNRKKKKQEEKEEEGIVNPVSISPSITNRILKRTAGILVFSSLQEPTFFFRNFINTSAPLWHFHWLPYKENSYTQFSQTSNKSNLFYEY